MRARINIMSSGYKFLKVSPLGEVDALELGAEVFSELLILGFGVGILGWEYGRSKEKEVEKKRLEEEKLEALFQGVREELRGELTELKREIDDLKTERRNRFGLGLSFGKKEEKEKEEEEEEEKKEDTSTSDSSSSSSSTTVVIASSPNIQKEKTANSFFDIINSYFGWNVNEGDKEIKQ